MSCSSPSSTTPSGPSPNQPPGPQRPARPAPEAARGSSIDGKWSTACFTANKGRSLSWSLELAGRAISSTEYVFTDGACQSLSSTQAETGLVDIEADAEGTNAKFTQLGRDRVTVASYDQSVDKVYFNVRGGTEFARSRIRPSPDKIREFVRTESFPAFRPIPSRLTDSIDFGVVTNQSLTYIAQVVFEDKRDQGLIPYNAEISREIIGLETVQRKGRLDVHQTATASNNSDFYWSEMASQPEPFVRKASWHTEHSRCASGAIQTVPSALGPLRACVTDQLPKIKTIYSSGPSFVGLFFEYEFQNDMNFHIVHSYELIGANW